MSAVGTPALPHPNIRPPLPALTTRPPSHHHSCQRLMDMTPVTQTKSHDVHLSCIILVHMVLSLTALLFTEQETKVSLARRCFLFLFRKKKKKINAHIYSVFIIGFITCFNTTNILS